MSIQITVTVDDKAIADATQVAFAQAFGLPAYAGRTGGYGYETIREQVRAFVGTMDLRERIAAEARVSLSAVLRDVVGEELRRAAKAEAKRLRQNGELFAGAKT